MRIVAILYTLVMLVLLAFLWYFGKVNAYTVIPLGVIALVIDLVYRKRRLRQAVTSPAGLVMLPMVFLVLVVVGIANEGAIIGWIMVCAGALVIIVWRWFLWK